MGQPSSFTQLVHTIGQSTMNSFPCVPAAHYSRRRHYRSFALSLAVRHRPDSTFTYKGQAVDVKQVGRELGVRYVLEGSVRKAGNRIRVTAQLIEAETGNHVWANRYDRDLVDIFAVQDEITH